MLRVPINALQTYSNSTTQVEDNSWSLCVISIDHISTLTLFS